MRDNSGMDAIQHYGAESAFLCELLLGLPPKSLRTPTQFKEWTVEDTVLHLYGGDQLGLTALQDPQSFSAIRDAITTERRLGKSVIEETRQRYPGLSGVSLMNAYAAQTQDLFQLLQKADEKARLPWFGPDMSLATFATARHMETWAHGQTMRDALGISSVPTDRLYSIARLGVRTFEWSFRNRGLPVPVGMPGVTLIAPSGAVWRWGDGQHGSISGSVLEFCQVVAQLRSPQDTNLQVRGEVARKWMNIAQCFAGPPSKPPMPGTRSRSSITISMNPLLLPGTQTPQNPKGR